VHELYKVLGVRSAAADEEIKTAFRRLAKQLHPDLHPGDADTERRFQHVIRAYETLSDRRSRMAYDAGLKSQRLLRRWQFRANAMTLVAAFSLTVSVGLHWGTLSRAILPAGEDMARLASKESQTATSGKAEGISSPGQGASLHAAAERGDAAALKSAELNAEPSSALQGHSSANELTEELSANPMTPEAPPLQFLTLADLDLAYRPANEMPPPQRSVRNKSPELNAELSSPLQDQSSTNEIAELSAKPMPSEASSLTLALAELDLSPTNEMLTPQRSVSKAHKKAQSGSGAGWWVILGSFNVDEGDSAAGVRRATGAARRCGMDAFNDLSLKFRGFAPGYMVVVIGPFADKVDAARSRQQVNGCVSGTYVKYAQHLGQSG
jgi:curved DNA-binding protein CbpA